MPDRDLTLPADLVGVVDNALAEDIGDGDRNAALIDDGALAHARVVVRENAILSGSPWFAQVFAALDDRVHIDWACADGERITAGTTVCELQGPVRALLTGERTALNFLQMLSGVASVTHEFVERVRGTAARIVDTRKTLPGLRSAQRYAVRCGGGHNHRFGLFDAILIKENHIMAAGSIAAAVGRARTTAPNLFLQVEIENLDELEQALEAGVDGVLIDNLPEHMLTRAVNMTRAHRHRFRREIAIEASGDISLSNVRAVADAGVERISIGGLTKHLRATDFSMRMHQK